ncbi:GmrSD restriction endonuclease domain-containing protein [Mesorhizobium sp. A623]
MSDIEQLREDLNDLANVEDPEEDVSTTGELFSISSFGVDYPVETLVSRMDKKLFYIPPFQRAFVWSQNQCSRFIESLLLGLPVPGIFLFKEADSGKHLVIDGQQRLKSLLYFSQGVINGKEFALTGLETKFGDRTYKTLDEADRARLDDAVIHATVFKQDLPEGEINSVYEVFERINTGGIKLSPQEIRSCICHGNFNNYLHKLNDNVEWRAVYGPKSKRLKDVEIILRFMAFYEKGEEYKSPMKHFLNDYMKEKRNLSDAQLQDLGDIFVKMIDFVTRALGARPFRPDRSLNTAVFDSVASALAHRLAVKAEPQTEEALSAYNALLQNERFIEGYIRSTADEENVKKRMEEAGKAFAAI